MFNSWRTKDDVLKDIGAVNGRRTGVENLDQHVVEGERPPPVRRETPDEDELKYFSAGLGCSVPDNNKGPDLAGISVMLQMVNEMDDTADRNEPITLYHNKSTDEISISKLNPSAGEYIPGRKFNGGSSHTKVQVNVPQHTNGINNSSNMFKSRNKRKETSNSVNGSPNREVNTMQRNNQSQLKPNLLTNGLPKRTIYKSETKDMFAPSTATVEGKVIKGQLLRCKIDTLESKDMFSPSKATVEGKEIKDQLPRCTIDTSETKDMFSPSKTTDKRKEIKDALPKRTIDTSETKDMFSPSKTTDKGKEIKDGLPKRTIDTSETKDMFSPIKITDKGKEIKDGLPKRTIDTSETKDMFSTSKTTDKGKEIQEKIKSTIIASSNDNSLKTKRQKNVAIATLLKMGAISSAVEEKPLKLIKPDYFENPPSKTESNVESETPANGGPEEEHIIPSTSSSEMDLNYVDPDSISKVTGWFNNNESPKPKPQRLIQKPLVLKETVTFKKKGSSSASSHFSEASKEKKEPTKEPKVVNTAFEPSSYADELLKKYENNAKRAVSSREDLGTMLERQLRERDEVVRQKMLARQNAG